MPPSESRTSARRRSYGIAEAAGQSITRSSGRIGTADRCDQLAAACHREFVNERTGLVLDPYFSATKIAWILDEVPGAPECIARGELAFGTVDTFLLWRLTGGTAHATDPTNGSRTELLNIHTGQWDDDLLRLFGVPRAMLPEICETAAPFGEISPEHLGAALPVYAMVGDQQSAMVGQLCLRPGMVKATYCTGGFVLLNTGLTSIRSRHGLLTTIAYQWDGVRRYALEGSIFSAGATVHWLRDGLGVIANSAEASMLAGELDIEQEVYLVPAFAGLGAPYWRADARGSIIGLTCGATRKEVARAALESVGFQTRDLLSAMIADFAAADQGDAVRDPARRRRHSGRHRRRACRSADLQGNDGAGGCVPRRLASLAFTRRRTIFTNFGASTGGSSPR